MEQTRVKMVSDPTWEHENLLSGIARMITKHGCAGCFQGLAAMLFKQLPYTMTKQVGFDIVATFFRRLAKELVEGNIDDLKFVISTCAAFVAAVLACICSQPGDMILTRTFRNRGVKMTTIARDIYQMNGIGGFYIGLTCRLAHVVSIITCQLVLYDIIKQALGLPVTGSN
jgi:solute carrier family 25 phosphate transporter 3